MPCRGAAPAAPAALRVAIRMRARPRPWHSEGRPSFNEKVRIKEGRGRLRTGFSRAGTPAPVPRRPGPRAAPSLPPRPPPTVPPLPPPPAPSLGARSSHRASPGRSAASASGSHRRRGLRRGTRSGTGNAAALWWAEAGGAGSPARRSGRGARLDAPQLCWVAPTCGRLGPELPVSDRVCTGEPRLHGDQRGERSPPNAGVRFRAAVPAAAASSGPECHAEGRVETPQDPDHGRLDPLEPREDDPCSTCSSSSDSEPEGVFLGQPLPRPCEPPGVAQAGNDASRKHCTIC